MLLRVDTYDSVFLMVQYLWHHGLKENVTRFGRKFGTQPSIFRRELPTHATNFSCQRGFGREGWHSLGNERYNAYCFSSPFGAYKTFYIFSLYLSCRVRQTLFRNVPIVSSIHRHSPIPLIHGPVLVVIYSAAPLSKARTSKREGAKKFGSSDE